MKLSGETQAVIVKYALIGAALIGAAYYIKKSVNWSGLADSVGDLGDGLKNPIDALGALVGVMPENKSTITLNENFKYYIELNGGQEKYILQHKNGTWTGGAYDENTDYKKLFQQKTLNPFFLQGRQNAKNQITFRYADNMGDDWTCCGFFIWRNGFDDCKRFRRGSNGYFVTWII